MRRMTLMWSLPSCLGASLGNSMCFERPEIPVGDFEKETLVEFRTVQRLLPRGVQFDEIRELVLVAKRVEREVMQNFDVGPVR